MLRKALLACGVLSSLLYVGADLLAAVRFPGYHDFFSQAISELTAIGAPTRGLVAPLLIAYDVLMIAFGVGVWMSPGGRRRTRQLVGGLLSGVGAVGLAAFPLAPMHLRGTGSLAADAPHIAVTGVIVLCIFLAVGLGASLFGRGFRLYSYATLAALLVFLGWTGLEAARLAALEPTPWLGAVERLHIGAYLLWVAVLAAALLRPAVATARAPGGAEVCGLA